MMTRDRPTPTDEELVVQALDGLAAGARPTGERPVLLIDEIDKADTDFQDDMLDVLDQMEFDIIEIDKTIKALTRPESTLSADERRARRRSQEPGVPPPGVSERRTGVERRRLDRDMAAFTCHLPGHREVPHRQWQACPLRACLLATLLATLIIAWIGVAFR